MSLSDLVASGVRFGVTFSSFAISTVVPIVNVLAAFYSFWSLFKMEKSHVYKRNVQWKFNRGVLLSVLIFSFTVEALLCFLWMFTRQTDYFYTYFILEQLCSCVLMIVCYTSVFWITFRFVRSMLANVGLGALVLLAAQFVLAVSACVATVSSLLLRERYLTADNIDDHDQAMSAMLGSLGFMLNSILLVVNGVALVVMNAHLANVEHSVIELASIYKSYLTFANLFGLSFALITARVWYSASIYKLTITPVVGVGENISYGALLVQPGALLLRFLTSVLLILSLYNVKTCDQEWVKSLGDEMEHEQSVQFLSHMLDGLKSSESVASDENTGKKNFDEQSDNPSFAVTADDCDNR